MRNGGKETGTIVGESFHYESKRHAIMLYRYVVGVRYVIYVIRVLHICIYIKTFVEEDVYTRRRGKWDFCARI